MMNEQAQRGARLYGSELLNVYTHPEAKRVVEEAGFIYKGTVDWPKGPRHSFDVPSGSTLSFNLPITVEELKRMAQGH